MTRASEPGGRRHPVRLIALLGCLVASLLVPFGLAGTPAAAQATFAQAVKVISPDTASMTLSAISCASAGSCAAVGGMNGGRQAIAAEETGGTWGQAVVITPPPDFKSLADLYGVSCVSTGNCAAVGTYGGSTNSNQAMAVAETGGTWGQAVEITAPADAQSSPAAVLDGVSCTSAGNCVAVGSYAGRAGLQAMVVLETDGTWAQAQKVVAPADAAASEDVSLSAVSCGSPGNCSAVGNYLDGSGGNEAMQATETGGTWDQAAKVPAPADADTNPFASLSGVSCTSADNCTAVGNYEGGSGIQAMAATDSAGTWSQAAVVPPPADANANPAATLLGVSCTSTGDCTAVGGYLDGSHHRQAWAAAETSGTWVTGTKLAQPADATASSIEIGMFGVSCPGAGSCTAAGMYDNENRAMAATETSGTWAQAVDVIGPDGADPGAELNGVACTSAGDCVGVGNYTDTSGTDQVMQTAEVNGMWEPATKVTLPADASATGPLPDLNAVACGAAGTCMAGGDYVDTLGSGQAMLVSETNGTWGQAVKVNPPANARSDPFSRLFGVGCTLGSSCSTAVGDYQDSAGDVQAMALVGEGGAVEVTAPGGAASDPVATLYGVACTSQGNCTAVGTYRDAAGHEQAMEATETDNTWGQAAQISAPANAGTDPIAILDGISCPSAGNCVAVGDYTDGASHEHLMEATETDGTWGQAAEVVLPTGATGNGFDDLTGVSCPSAGNCVAVGRYVDTSNDFHALEADETAGTWGQATEVAAPPDAGTQANHLVGLLGVSCTGDGGCSSVGQYQDGLGRAQAMAAGSSPITAEGLAVTLAGTGTGTVSSDPSGITCPGSCSANYAQNTTVTLTAAPTNGSTFSGWSGAGCAGSGTCQVDMTGTESVTATFAAAGNNNGGGNNGGAGGGGTGGSSTVSTTTTTVAPAPAAPAGPCASATGNAAFVCAAYEKLLGRSPDPQGLATYLGFLNTGESPTQVAVDMTSSPEYRSDLVQSWYRAFLGRPAGQTGLADWTSALQAGQADQTVEAGILSSPEFYGQAGGTPPGFVAALYRDLLGRAPDPAGAQIWAAALAGGASRAEVASGILQSAEARADFVQAAYGLVLGRPADPPGLAAWVAELGSGGIDEEVLAGLVGSPEFYGAATGG